MNNVRIVKAEKLENKIFKLLIGSSTASLEIYSYAREFMRWNYSYLGRLTSH